MQSVCAEGEVKNTECIIQYANTILILFVRIYYISVLLHSCTLHTSQMCKIRVFIITSSKVPRVFTNDRRQI